MSGLISKKLLHSEWLSKSLLLSLAPPHIHFFRTCKVGGVANFLNVALC